MCFLPCCSLFLLLCVSLTHPSWSVRFHSTLGVGIRGEPSYNTTEVPTASADTSQFHIIQPVCRRTQTEVSGSEHLPVIDMVKLADK